MTTKNWYVESIASEGQNNHERVVPSCRESNFEKMKKVKNIKKVEENMKKVKNNLDKKIGMVEDKVETE